MGKINTKELAKDFQLILQSKDIKVTTSESKEIVEDVFTTIIQHLVNGDTVDIYGFGKFEPKLRKARNGVNPQTKEKVVHPEVKTATFKFAKRAKDAIKG